MPEDQKQLENLSGEERAAILLLSVGHDIAAEVFRHLNPREVSRVSGAMARLGDVHKPDVENTMRDFVERASAQTTVGFGTEEFLRETLTKALGPDKAGNLLDRVTHAGELAGIEAVKWREPRVVAEIFKTENPQVVAVFLASMESEQAAEFVNWLPDELVREVIPRLATLDAIQPSALRILSEMLEETLSGETQHMKFANVGGVKAAAGILNRLEQSRSDGVLEVVRERDWELAARIQESMFVFADLIELDDRGMQVLVREIPPDILPPALKGADGALGERFFQNMSERAVAGLKEDMAARGPLRRSEVEKAQKEIIQLAQKLEQEGKLILRASSDVVA